MAMNVNLTNLATRKHGSEADFLIMERMNILCWHGAGSYAWGAVFLSEGGDVGQHVTAQLELLGRRTCVVTAEGVFVPVAR